MNAMFIDIVGVIWLVWGAYWFVSARGVKAAARTDGYGAAWLMYRAPLVIGFLLLFISHSRWLPWLWQRWLPVDLGWSVLGLVLVLAGLAFATWARVTLGRNWSATVQLKQDHELIVVGPYRLARHPIYTGMLLGVLGTAVTIGEWRGLLALVFVAVSLWIKLRHEEAWMRECFGETYVAYQRRVKALIPGVL
ncbi:MAG TPA: isoprenylcysteine carboxylmethyltransferase family protein [Rhodanobacteraceae bacterium]